MLTRRTLSLYVKNMFIASCGDASSRNITSNLRTERGVACSFASKGKKAARPRTENMVNKWSTAWRTRLASSRSFPIMRPTLRFPLAFPFALGVVVGSCVEGRSAKNPRSNCNQISWSSSTLSSTPVSVSRPSPKTSPPREHESRRSDTETRRNLGRFSVSGGSQNAFSTPMKEKKGNSQTIANGLKLSQTVAKGLRMAKTRSQKVANYLNFKERVRAKTVFDDSQTV